ncbi:phosphodiester glycosidase family protein [Caldicellulosiruptor morganii]|uniref:Phosphodiester glycosidase family protein n=1 Tax=Caldicellulosiruptor morganii TaxID=1387555 RepID=A0ABY7BNS2_9FIRM|nr:phosphodiester glycosidase family protein [Caldicellulosiruptor morganii]WAM33701.1 phosphodiester glycosidase family protein [Caldicellulosiruptor morganii]
MKRFFGFVSLATIVSIFISAFAKPHTEILRFKTVQQIAPRTYYEKYELLTDEGFVDINCIKLDLIDGGFDFDVLKANIANTGNFVYNMVYRQSDRNPVAAINANFFYTNTRTDYNRIWPIGISVSGGRILSSPNNRQNTFPAFVYTTSNEILFDYINGLSYKLVNVATGYEFKIAHVNKFTGDLTYPILFTGEYVQKTIGNRYRGIVEIIIKDGIIKEIREQAPAIDLDKSEYLLAATGNYAKSLLKNFKTGDRVEIKIDLSFPLEKIKAAASGNTFLLKDGKIPAFTHEIAGRHPRSAIGIDKTSRYLYFVSVDGRNGKSIGLTQTELAGFLQSIGIWTAINLDGGDSTQLVAKDNDGTLKAFYNRGDTRKVFDSIAAFYKYTDDKIATFYIDCPDRVFAGEEYPVKVYAKDRFYNTITYDAVYLKVYQDAYEIDIKDGVFTPYKDGVVTISCVYEDVYYKAFAQKKISVYRPEILDTDKKQLYLLPGESANLRFYIKDRLGHFEEIDPGKVQAEENPAFEFKDGVFRAKSDFQGFVTFTYKDLKCSLPVGIGQTTKLLRSFDYLAFDFPKGVSMFLSSKNRTQGKYSNKIYFSSLTKGKSFKLKFKTPVDLTSVNEISFDLCAKNVRVYFGFRMPDGTQKEVEINSLKSDNFKSYSLNVESYKTLEYISVALQNTQGYIWIDNLTGSIVNLPPVEDIKQYVAKFSTNLAKTSVIFLTGGFENLPGDIKKKVESNLGSYLKYYSLEKENPPYEKNEKFNIVFLKTRSGSVLDFSFYQWIRIKNLSAEKKPLIVVLDIPFERLNQNEKGMLIRLLKSRKAPSMIICQTGDYTRVERYDTLYIGYASSNKLLAKSSTKSVNLACDVEKGYIYLARGY